MIFGGYPCCDAPLAIQLPDKTPAYFRELCPSCGVPVWHRFSRLDPQSWTEEEFLKEYRIDEATKSIEPLHPPQADSFSLLTDAQREALAEMMNRQLLYGDSSGGGSGGNSG